MNETQWDYDKLFNMFVYIWKWTIWIQHTIIFIQHTVISTGDSWRPTERWSHAIFYCMSCCYVIILSISTLAYVMLCTISQRSLSSSNSSIKSFRLMRFFPYFRFIFLRWKKVDVQTSNWMFSLVRSSVPSSWVQPICECGS